MNSMTTGCGHDHGPVMQVPGKDSKLIKKLVDTTIRRLHSGLYKGRVSPELSTAIGQSLFDGASKELNVNFAKIDYSTPDNEVTYILRNNLFMFSAAKSYSEIKQFSDQLLDENGKLKPFPKFKSDVLAIHEKYNVNWLNAEYNYAVASAQMGAQWKRYWSNRDVLPYLTFSTAGDDRVSDEHARLNDITLPIENSFWDSHYPPLRPNCRCDVEQTSNPSLLTNEDEAKQLADSVEVPPMFRNNFGKTNIIFKDNHPYFKDVDGKISELQAARDYGMKDSKAIYADPNKLPKASPEGSFDNWYKKALKKNNYQGKGLTYKDHNGNSFLFPQKVFNSNSNASLVGEVMSNPTEVWQQDKNNAIIKMYNDRAVIVTTDNKLKATNYIVLDGKDLENKLDLYRQGVIMKR